VVSGGVTNQFNAENVPALAEQMQNLGTMFDTADLARIADPAALIKNLMNQGLGDVGNLSTMVEENQLDLEYPDDTEKAVLTNILEQIKGSDLDEIISVTNFEPAFPENISTLADVLDINNLFTEDALAAVGESPTLEDLSNKLSNIGGKFGSLSTVGTFLSSLVLRSFPLLNSLKSPLPDNLVSNLSSSLGQGAGPFGNPTAADMTASASGFGYTDDLKFIIDTQVSLLESSDTVSAFKTYLDIELNLDPNELQNLIDQINIDLSIADDISNANEKMIACAERLSTEKTNLGLAGIIPGTTESNKMGVMTFANSLHNFGVDPMRLSLGNQLDRMATSDLYGESIQAGLIEGINLGRMSVFGISPGTKLDPMAYAQSLRASA